MGKIGYHSVILEADTGKGKQATITVFDSGTIDLATIYANTGGDLEDNPFDTDSVGRFSFFTDSGVYDIQVSGVGIVTYKLEGVPIVTFLSIPPSGKYKIKNIYIDPDTGKYKVEYDDTPI